MQVGEQGSGLAKRGMVDWIKVVIPLCNSFVLRILPSS
jgi:hypothetical protein